MALSMRRIILVLAVAAVMAAMMVAVSAVPALASDTGCTYVKNWQTGERSFVCY